MKMTPFSSKLSIRGLFYFGRKLNFQYNNSGQLRRYLCDFQLSTIWVVRLKNLGPNHVRRRPLRMKKCHTRG